MKDAGKPSTWSEWVQVRTFTFHLLSFLCQGVTGKVFHWIECLTPIQKCSELDYSVCSRPVKVLGPDAITPTCSTFIPRTSLYVSLDKSLTPNPLHAYL